MKLEIAIVGSGTSGLAAAAFLARDGHKITLFERFSAPRPLGAGIMLQPTGLAVLACLGLDEKALFYGARISHLQGQSANGSTVFDIRYADLVPHAYGLGIHRGALFQLLYDEVLSSDVSIVTDCEMVQSVMIADKRVLIDKSNQKHGPFDLVIDASGARSLLRGDDAKPFRHHRQYPYGAIWGVCTDPQQAFAQGYLRQRYDGAHVMIGALAIGKRPSDHVETLAFFWSLRADAYQRWRDEGLEPWKIRVVKYWPEMEPFINQFKSVEDLTFAKYTDSIMHTWYADRIVHIGDAAHCTSPQLGQGANLGLIDALTLSASLRECNQVNAALAQYHRSRFKHVNFYQVASRWLTPFFQSDSRVAAWLRDKTFGVMCKTPYVKTEMLRTLAGVKTGVFTQVDPAIWHPRYAFRKSQP